MGGRGTVRRGSGHTATSPHTERSPHSASSSTSGGVTAISTSTAVPCPKRRERVSQKPPALLLLLTSGRSRVRAAVPCARVMARSQRAPPAGGLSFVGARRRGVADGGGESGEREGLARHQRVDRRAAAIKSDGVLLAVIMARLPQTLGRTAARRCPTAVDLTRGRGEGRDRARGRARVGVQICQGRVRVSIGTWVLAQLRLTQRAYSVRRCGSSAATAPRLPSSL